MFGSNTSVSGWPSPGILPPSLSFPPFCQGENESTIPTRRVLLAGVETSHPITAAWLSQLHPGTALRYPPEQHQLLHLHGSARQQNLGRIPQLLFCPLTRRDGLVSAFPPREPVNVPGSPDGPPLAPAVISPRPTANHDSASIPRCHSAPLILLCLIRGNLLRLPPRPTSSPRGFAGVCVAHPA